MDGHGPREQAVLKDCGDTTLNKSHADFCAMAKRMGRLNLSRNVEGGPSARLRPFSVEPRGHPVAGFSGGRNLIPTYGEMLSLVPVLFCSSLSGSILAAVRCQAAGFTFDVPPGFVPTSVPTKARVFGAKTMPSLQCGDSATPVFAPRGWVEADLSRHPEVGRKDC